MEHYDRKKYLDIVNYAKEFNTHPAMIIGRLQYLELIPYSVGREFILRIALGSIFLAHGWQKINGFAGVEGFFATLGLPPFLPYVITALERFVTISEEPLVQDCHNAFPSQWKQVK